MILVCIYIYIYTQNDSGDQGGILGRVITKTQKMVLNVALLNTVL